MGFFGDTILVSFSRPSYTPLVMAFFAGEGVFLMVLELVVFS